MDRLISADALMREVETLISNNKQLIDEWFANVITDAIDDAPTVDAEPVRHGHWVRHLDTRFGRLLNDIIICSCCGIAFSTEDMIRRSYCPNCGAKMDEEEK